MADPADFYTDLASINVSQVGVTLIFLRSAPIPRLSDVNAGGPDSPDIGEAPAVQEQQTEELQVEIVGRVRMSAPFLAQLRNLIDTTLRKIEEPAGDKPDHSGPRLSLGPESSGSTASGAAKK